jgi:hypothetical protein
MHLFTYLGTGPTKSAASCSVMKEDPDDNLEDKYPTTANLRRRPRLPSNSVKIPNDEDLGGDLCPESELDPRRPHPPPVHYGPYYRPHSQICPQDPNPENPRFKRTRLPHPSLSPRQGTRHPGSRSSRLPPEPVDEGRHSPKKGTRINGDLLPLKS